MQSTDVKLQELESVLGALSKVQAIIHFDRNGNILEANENFCKTVGYREDEIVGKHHRMFVDPIYARSEEYTEFWRKLGRGETVAGDFTRIGKNGGEVYLEASYNALRNPAGEVDRVVEFAIDVTERQKTRDALLRQLSQTIGDISTEAQAMIAKSTELSKRSENQAATVEETSAAMEEISQTVNSNVKNAEQATEEARHAKQQAEKGSDVVESAIAAMKKIENGSKEIRKFIEVIDSIAFQTNLLALNAGVEAARAGDAGRGFAVVASEVRALAQRASESAKDINALIDNSSREVDEGARLVNETGAVLADITEGVTKVASGIESIFTASSEQASGVHEINQSITNIDKDTQLNAAMSQESAASAANLARSASELEDSISRFRHQKTDHAGSRSDQRQRVAAPKPAVAKPRVPITPMPKATPESKPDNPAPIRAERKVAVNETPSYEHDDDDDDAWTEF